MNFFKDISTSWKKIPQGIQKFLKKALIIFIIWKLIYSIFLFPGRIIDAPLTNLTSKGARWLILKLKPGNELIIRNNRETLKEDNNENNDYSDALYLNGRKIVGIADPCNALELYILYIGFLIAYPGSIKRKTMYSLLGIMTIYISNIMRLVFLALMFLNHFNGVNIAHHYIFKLIVYFIIFSLWILFTRKMNFNEEVTY